MIFRCLASVEQQGEYVRVVSYLHINVSRSNLFHVDVLHSTAPPPTSIDLAQIYAYSSTISHNCPYY